jgi:hypothetical protein
VPWLVWHGDDALHEGNCDAAADRATHRDAADLPCLQSWRPPELEVATRTATKATTMIETTSTSLGKPSTIDDKSIKIYLSTVRRARFIVVNREASRGSAKTGRADMSRGAASTACR